MLKLTKEDLKIAYENPNKRCYFVFQGETFGEELRAGIIWAPKQNKDGQDFHYWKRLEELKKGDIIFHCRNGIIEAVSVVSEKFTDGYFPNKLLSDDKYEMIGRLVKCDYFRSFRVCKIYDYREEIKRKNDFQYSPFNKNGLGNQGYLFQLNKDLADFFISKCFYF